MRLLNFFLPVSRVFTDFPYNPIHPALIANKDAVATIAHKITPCKSGRGPTCFSTFFDNPVPIKNKVTVSPILPSLLKIAYPGARTGK